MVRSQIYFGGIPTGPDVKKLMAAYPAIAIDQEIPYDAVETLLGFSRNASRFRTVTMAWRRRLLREFNFQLVPTKAASFKRLAETDRSRYNIDGARVGTRKVTRHTRDLHLVDTSHMPEPDLKSHTHRTRVMTTLVEHAHASMKELAPPKAPRQLPKFKPE